MENQVNCRRSFEVLFFLECFLNEDLPGHSSYILQECSQSSRENQANCLDFCRLGGVCSEVLSSPPVLLWEAKPMMWDKRSKRRRLAISVGESFLSWENRRMGSAVRELAPLWVGRAPFLPGSHSSDDQGCV